jgi:hypothetical protein
MCAYGFRHIPRHRRHAPEYYERGFIYGGYPPPMSFESMPILRFEPFEVRGTVTGRIGERRPMPKTIFDAPYNDVELDLFRAIKRGDLKL